MRISHPLCLNLYFSTQFVRITLFPPSTPQKNNQTRRMKAVVLVQFWGELSAVRVSATAEVNGGCHWQKSLVDCQCDCRVSGECHWQKSLGDCQRPCLKLVLSWREDNCECDVYRNCKRRRAAIFLFGFEKHSYQNLVGWSETQVNQQSAGGGGDLHLAHSPPGL